MTLKKSLLRTLIQLSILTTALTIALSLNYLYAWTGPTGTAPANNVGAPINITNATQVKDGNVSVGLGTNSTAVGLNPLGLTIAGSQRVEGWLKVGDGATGNPTQLLDLTGTPGTDGIKFPDGTVQTTAGAPAGSTNGIGTDQLVGYTCLNTPDCTLSCTVHGQNPTCTTPICPTGKTLYTHDDIDKWTDSGCTNIGSGGQCQGPWSRTYYRVVGLCG